MSGPPAQVAWLTAGLIALGLAYGITKRLILTPLARFPGPKMAALTGFYEIWWDVFRGPRFPWKVAELHARFGPIVRIGPNELHMDDPDFASTHFDVDPYADYVRRHAFGIAAIDTGDRHTHRLRRAPLDEFFSKRRIAQREGTIWRKVELMCDRLDEFRLSGKSLSLCLLFTCFATDVITAYTFPQSYGLLSDPSFCPPWHEALAVRLTRYRWLEYSPFLWCLARMFPERLTAATSTNLAFDFEKRARKQIGEIVRDDGGTTIFHEIMRSTLPSREKTVDRLWQEGRSIIEKGTESISRTLTIIVYSLQENPAILAKAKSELDTLPDPPHSSCRQLEGLRYLTAVIEEGLRISETILRYIRVVQDHDLRYRGQIIPAGTTIAANLTPFNNDGGFHPSSYDFLPERWLEPGRFPNHFVFSKGPRSCVGVHLAYTELYLALAAIIRRFDFDLIETNRADHVGNDLPRFKSIRAKVKSGTLI